MKKDRNDNRKSNLRFTTYSENNKNRRGVKGYYLATCGLWQAQTREEGQWVNLGTYKTEDEAAAAYRQWRNRGKNSAL